MLNIDTLPMNLHFYILEMNLIRGGGQGQKFVAVGAESRYLAFTATNRDFRHLPRQIAMISFFRNMSRFLWSSASDRDFIVS